MKKHYEKKAKVVMKRAQNVNLSSKKVRTVKDGGKEAVAILVPQNNAQLVAQPVSLELYPY